MRRLSALVLASSAAVFALWPGAATAGTTFYVDATHGQDSFNGTTPMVDQVMREGPWQTIARVSAQALGPGDSILFKRGEIWRDVLTLSSSGAPGAPITVGAYGTGSLPTISAADVVTGWTLAEMGGHTHRALAPSPPGVVHFSGIRGVRRARPELLAAANEWCWIDGNLYVQTLAEPGSTVEAGARGAAIAILGQSYITVEDVLLEHSNGSGLFVETSDRATSHIVIRRVTARESRYSGMTFKNGDPRLKTTAVLITGNTVYGNGASGINISEGVNDITISYNTSHHNNWSGDLYQAGIRVWANQSDARNLVVEHNEIYGMYFLGTGWQNGHGIWLDEVADDAVVRFNYAHDNENAGIFIEHSNRAHIYYNLVVDNGDASILLYRGVHHNEILNNTVYSTHTGIRLSGDGGADSVTDNVVKNNISLAVGPGGFGLMAGDGGENDGRLGSGNVYLYNALGPERAAFIVWGYHVPKNTYRDWEKAYAGTTYSVKGNPLFTGAADFSLQPDSPCLHAGVDLGLVEDILGVSVPATTRPDLGAYQSR